jgi:hypothetical protein
VGCVGNVGDGMVMLDGGFDTWSELVSSMRFVSYWVDVVYVRMGSPGRNV